MLVSKHFTLVILLVIQVMGQSSKSGNCSCGVRKYDDSPFAVRISGGTEAEINEFPWAVLLSIKQNGRRNPSRCGGTLINDRFVLTAAHCVPKSSGYDVEVILGEHNLRSKSESKELRLRVSDIIVHDQYEDKTRQGYVVYDFTLLKLSEPVNFKLYPHIRPICMPDSGFKDNQGDFVTVAGWGNTQVDRVFHGNGIIEGFDSAPSTTLQKVDIGLYSQQKCQDIFRPLDIDIRSINMCAASTSGDACGGDSGGGLVKKSSRGIFYEIVGVVSYGVGCRSTFKGETLPGVYARVSSVVSWIERKTSSGQYCRRPRPLIINTSLINTSLPSGWGDWSSYSQCSKSQHTCGVGKRTRDRFCKGSTCSRSQQTQERICNVKQC